jgi:hypothetical protein
MTIRFRDVLRHSAWTCKCSARSNCFTTYGQTKVSDVCDAPDVPSACDDLVVPHGVLVATQCGRQEWQQLMKQGHEYRGDIVRVFERASKRKRNSIRLTRSNRPAEGQGLRREKTRQ